jgi:hypothetical protein
VYYSQASIEIASVKTLWHPIQVERSDLRIYNFVKYRTNVFRAPGFSQPVIVKMGTFLQEIPHINWENEVYRYLSTNKDAEIGPRFLGHVMEQGRCVGFMLEWVQYFREAQIEDYELCVKALDDLRGIELKHGDISPSNFLI